MRLNATETGRLPDGSKATISLRDKILRTELWTTPQAHDAQGTPDPNRWRRFGTKHGGNNLPDHVAAAQLWQTPNAMGGGSISRGGGPQKRTAAGGTGEGMADAAGGGLGTDRGAFGDAGHADERGESVADASGTGPSQRRPLPGGAGATLAMPAGGCGYRWPARPGEIQHEWEASRLTQFGVGLSVDGTPGGLVRPADRDAANLARFQNKQALKAIGNSVVWIIPNLIGRWIMDPSPSALNGVAEH
jgi:hypothetical protein